MRCPVGADAAPNSPEAEICQGTSVHSAMDADPRQTRTDQRNGSRFSSRTTTVGSACGPRAGAV